LGWSLWYYFTSGWYPWINNVTTNLGLYFLWYISIPNNACDFGLAEVSNSNDLTPSLSNLFLSFLCLSHCILSTNYIALGQGGRNTLMSLIYNCRLLGSLETALRPCLHSDPAFMTPSMSCEDHVETMLIGCSFCYSFPCFMYFVMEQCSARR
jgi:hypothetical protein